MLRNDGGKIVEVLFSVFQPFSIRDGMYSKNREIYNMLVFDRGKGFQSMFACVWLTQYGCSAKPADWAVRAKAAGKLRDAAWVITDRNTGFITFDFEWIFGCSYFETLLLKICYDPYSVIWFHVEVLTQSLRRGT